MQNTEHRVGATPAVERGPERQPAGDAEAGAERDDGPRADAVRKHAHVQTNSCTDVRERSQQVELCLRQVEFRLERRRIEREDVRKTSNRLHEHRRG